MKTTLIGRLGLAGALLCAACQAHPPETATPQPTPITLAPQSESAMPLPVPTTLDPEASPTPRVSSTGAPPLTPALEALARIEEDGSFWLYASRRLSFLRVDLESGMVQTLRSSADCLTWLVPESTTVLCPQADQYLLRDLLSGAAHLLAIPAGTSLGATPDGRYLFYRLGGEADGVWEVYRYELATDQVTLIARDVPTGLNMPLLSADGRFLAYAEAAGPWENRVVIAAQGGLGVVEGPSAPSATWNWAWAPRQPWLLYGATDVRQEIGFDTQYLFVLDATTQESHQIAAAPEGVGYEDFLGANVWSPDETRVAVAAGHQLCVIELADRRQDCYAIASTTWRVLGGSLTWSPSGRTVALGVYAKDNPRQIQIVVVSVTERQVAMVLNVASSSFGWSP